MLARLRARLTYANVTASLALFLALGGTSYAALKIRGKDVVNGSLTSADLKDGSVQARDLAKGVLRVGPQGPAGPAGAPGAAGAPGTAGAAGAAGLNGRDGRDGTDGVDRDVVGYDVSATDTKDATVNDGGGWTHVLTLTLPAGTYYLTGAIQYFSTQQADVSCVLRTATDAEHGAGPRYDDTVGRIQLHYTDTVALADTTTLVWKCGAVNNSSVRHGSFERRSLRAVRLTARNP